MSCEVLLMLLVIYLAGVCVPKPGCPPSICLLPSYSCKSSLQSHSHSLRFSLPFFSSRATPFRFHHSLFSFIPLVSLCSRWERCSSTRRQSKSSSRRMCSLRWYAILLCKSTFLLCKSTFSSLLSLASNDFMQLYVCSHVHFLSQRGPPGPTGVLVRPPQPSTLKREENENVPSWA